MNAINLANKLTPTTRAMFRFMLKMVPGHEDSPLEENQCKLLRRNLHSRFITAVVNGRGFPTTLGCYS
ncbi:MAG: hypothetical protein ACU836_08355, partial [Gammaproteobacteria bacterium]